MPLPFLIPAAAALAAEFFPSLIGRLAGDRAEDVAKKVIDVAADAAGIPGSRDQSQIAERLRKDSVAYARAQIQLRRLDLEEADLEAQDRRDARARDAAFIAAGERNTRADVMLGGAFVGLLACIALVALPDTPIGSAELALVTTVAGALLKMISDAFAFEFGSSKGSKAKDRQIEQVQAALAKVAEGKAK